MCIKYMYCFDNFKGATDGEIKLWNLEFSNYAESFLGHYGAITCIEPSVNSAFTVTAAEDKTIKVWSMTLASVITNYEVRLAMSVII